MQQPSVYADIEPDTYVTNKKDEIFLRKKLICYI